MADSSLHSESLRALSALQAEFISRFVADGSAPFHQLIAPTGTGKTYIAIRLIGQLWELGRLDRALVISPASLQVEQLHRAREDAIDLNLIRLDRERLRELEAAVPPGEDPWPTRSIVVSSLQFARADDVVALLARGTWDLVVVDEAHHLQRQGAALIRSLVEHQRVRRLLLMTATPKDEQSVVDDVSITDWRERVHELTDRLSRSIHGEDATFSLSSDELQCLARLRDLSAALASDRTARMLGIILRRKAQSSLFTLEKTIRRLRNELAHPAMAGLRERASLVDDVDALEDVGMEGDGRRVVWADSETALQLLNEFIAALETLSVDSKLNTLREVLRSFEGGPDGTRTCVFTSFSDTADYLASSLEEPGSPVHRAIGRMSPPQREQGIRTFLEGGGVLLATDAGVQGCELSGVDLLVHYDHPESGIEEERRIERMWRVGRTKPLRIVSLHATDDLSEPTLRRDLEVRS